MGFKLPAAVPQESSGKKCNLCVNACQVSPGQVGYCGLPVNGREEASLSYYYDPLPTNCVADWVCAGSQDKGYKNLAVFYNACSFNCLFCQNWHFREANLSDKVSAAELAEKADAMTSCICFFGGDPTPQVPHALKVAQLARDLHKDKELRICWETNGSVSNGYLKEMVEISLESDGCIKFDLKSWSQNLNLALCGVTNKQTLENIKLAAAYIDKRPEPPLVVVSTLLVPGYVDVEEVENIAKFLAGINPSIPYSLLAFYPQFLMDDLPVTQLEHAQEAQEVALRAGLTNVRIGNAHLLNGS